MKKIVLTLGLALTSQLIFSQLTQANEPQVGDLKSMYVVDTGNVTLASIRTITGSNVTWDYSSINMNTSNTENLAVAAASSSAYASDFSSSTKSITQGTILSFFSSTPTARVSQGYVYDAGGNLGVVKVKFDSDEATMMTYPFSVGSSIVDAFSGTAATGMGNFPFTGKIHSSIDGNGTLKFGEGVELSGVFRLAIVDTAVATVPLLGTIELIRTQFEYYNLADQNLPIFIDATVEISGMGRERQVLSKNLAYAGININEIQNVTLFPNPSNGEFTVNGDFGVANIEVSDLTGKIIYQSEIQSGASVKLNDLNSGIYTLKVISNGKSSIQKFTVK